MVRPVMYWSFAKRSMTSSMDLNMQGNPRARRPASERTLTHGLGQDNQSRAGARRVRGSDGGSLRRHLPDPDALLDAGVLALLAPVDDAGARQGGREHEGGGDDREALHGGLLSIS